jgi:hypothetical protein
MYEIINIGVDETQQIIRKKISENLYMFIPFDEGNSDYQEYLRWVEENK